MDYYKQLVIPEIAAELLSTAYLHCVLKGLHLAPAISTDPDNYAETYWADADIDFLISPDCWGEPHELASEANIQIIIVKSNKTIFTGTNPGAAWNYALTSFVESYKEAAGLIMSWKAGLRSFAQ